MKKKLFCLPVLACILIYACSRPIEQTLRLAVGNRAELEAVLTHYEKLNDYRKLQAARFLISNMADKYSYEGEILNRYDTIFVLYASLYKAGIYDREPQVITDV